MNSFCVFGEFIRLQTIAKGINTPLFTGNLPALELTYLLFHPLLRPESRIAA